MNDFVFFFVPRIPCVLKNPAYLLNKSGRLFFIQCKTSEFVQKQAATLADFGGRV